MICMVMYMNRSINEWVNEIHTLAKSKGWWDDERELPEILALIHSEISEALEEGRKDVYFSVDTSDKPEGVAVELVDAVIRIMDYFGKRGWDMEEILNLKHEYNKTREYRHGKRF